MTERQVVTLYADTDFWAQAELCEGLLFLHCDVYNKSLVTLRKVKAGIEILKAEIKAKGYDKPVFTYTQNPRWVKLLGAEYLNDFEFEGRHFEVWIWE